LSLENRWRRAMNDEKDNRFVDAKMTF